MTPASNHTGLLVSMHCTLCAKGLDGNRCMEPKNRALLACAGGTTLLGHTVLAFFGPLPGCTEPVRQFDVPPHGSFLCMECQQQLRHFLGMPLKLQAVVPGTHLIFVW